MLKIVQAPEPVLAQIAQTVSKIDKKVLKLISEMSQTLIKQDNPKGVGLAAPQVGYPLKIFLTKPAAKSPVRIFINPEITWRSDDLVSGLPAQEGSLEGCLSLPGVWGTVKRHASLKLRYQSPDGKIHEELFKGFLAIIIQHEMDHLEGHLFPQRVLEQKGKLYKIGAKDKEGKETLEEIELI